MLCWDDKSIQKNVKAARLKMRLADKANAPKKAEPAASLPAVDLRKRPAKSPAPKPKADKKQKLKDHSLVETAGRTKNSKYYIRDDG